MGLDFLYHKVQLVDFSIEMIITVKVNILINYYTLFIRGPKVIILGLSMEFSIDGGRTCCHFFISESKRF